MTLDKKKVLIAGVPVAVGATLLAVLGGLNLHRTPVSSPSGASTGGLGQAEPQNPEHERAMLEEELKQKPGHPPILFRLAEIERDAGHRDKAIAYLRQILDRDRSNQDTLLELGRELYEAGDVDGAIQATKRLLDVNPRQVDGLYNMGAIYANLGQTDLARGYWSKAVESSPASDSGRKAEDSLAKIGAPARHIPSKE
jgi:tetratricopeptide (TPR) repeat protein